jgi:hypothetical protein
MSIGANELGAGSIVAIAYVIIIISLLKRKLDICKWGKSSLPIGMAWTSVLAMLILTGSIWFSYSNEELVIFMYIILFFCYIMALFVAISAFSSQPNDQNNDTTTKKD